MEVMVIDIFLGSRESVIARQRELLSDVIVASLEAKG